MKELIEFIIPTYNKVNELKCMLASLIAQTSKNWRATVVVDGGNKEMIDIIIHPNIRYLQLDKRYNDWGQTPRDIGKQNSQAAYVVMTGDDNYYVPTCVDEIIKAAETNPGMIYWDMVHSHYDYHYFKCSPAYNQIDIGSFATRVDIAHQIKLNTSYAADGEFVEEYKRRFLSENIVKIEKILYVHN